MMCLCRIFVFEECIDVKRDDNTIPTSMATVCVTTKILDLRGLQALLSICDTKISKIERKKQKRRKPNGSRFLYKRCGLQFL